jgi:hypothetical protein
MMQDIMHLTTATEVLGWDIVVGWGVGFVGWFGEGRIKKVHCVRL